MQLAGASARLYGGETRIDGGSQPDGTLRFIAEGQASGWRPGADDPAFAAICGKEG